MRTEEIQRLLRNLGLGIVSADEIAAMRIRYDNRRDPVGRMERAAWDALAIPPQLSADGA